MTTLSSYSLYSGQANCGNADFMENFEHTTTLETMNAFLKISELETLEQKVDFVKTLSHGQRINRILEYDNEKIIIEYSEDSVKVTLYSNIPERNNKYFEIIHF